MAITRYEATRGNLVAPRLLVDAIVPALDALALVIATVAARPSAAGAACAVGFYLALAAGGSQSPRIDISLRRVIPAIAGQLSVAVVVLSLALGHVANAADTLRLGCVAIAAVLGSRAFAAQLTRELRRRGYASARAIIVGSDGEARTVGASLREHPEYGLDPVALLHDGVDDDGVSGSIADLPVIAREAPLQVIVTAAAASKPEVRRALRSCTSSLQRVHVIAPLGEGPTSPVAGGDHVWGYSFSPLRFNVDTSVSWALKRALDVVVSAVALVVVAPVLGVAILAVRLSAPGPALIRQKRIGRDGTPFEMLKLRTMRVNNDGDTMWSVADDERITKPGRLLRKTGIDELPQLVNILRGEMSLVGPRPERPFFVDQFVIEHGAEYEERHRVAPGLTGWSQVHGLRGDTSIAERIRFDNWYIDNWSLWLDIAILVRTFASVAKGSGS